MIDPNIYKSGIKQVQSSKVSGMGVDNLKDQMVSLYHLIHLGEYSYYEDEEME